LAGKATKRLDTNKEAAEHLGITVWAVRERIWAGALSFVRFPGGQKMYVDELDLEALIERNKEKAALPD
jgi:excisionase family DNA binding protein